ncbi:unnamed protein product [Porites lobata]|uniref:Uncharacterized protein n=1 Tax=Porites lobata TaxID=104759 RepID=A0ABN8RI20_9CNID|nr:unnamed protein product [Porites lobata]
MLCERWFWSGGNLLWAKRDSFSPPVGADNKIDPLFNVKTHDQVKKYFLVIARLGEGDYFGVGEDLTKMSIISVKKVEIVMVPRTVMIKHDQGKSEEEMRLQRDREFPSTNEIFHSFVTGEKWKHYKLDVLDRLRTPKWLLNPTTLDDVPLSIRQLCVRQCKFYSKRKCLTPVR